VLGFKISEKNSRETTKTVKIIVENTSQKKAHAFYI